MATATTREVKNGDIESCEDSNDINENSSDNSDDSDPPSENLTESEIDNTDENTESTNNTDKLEAAVESDSDDDVQEIEDENLKNVIELSSEDESESERAIENENLRKALEETKAKVKLLKCTKLSRIVTKFGERTVKLEESESSEKPRNVIRNTNQHKPIFRKILCGKNEFIENCELIERDDKKILVIRKFRKLTTNDKSAEEKSSSTEPSESRVCRKLVPMPVKKAPEIKFPKAIVYPKVSINTTRPSTTTAVISTNRPPTSTAVAGKHVPTATIDTPKFRIVNDIQKPSTSTAVASTNRSSTTTAVTSTKRPPISTAVVGKLVPIAKNDTPKSTIAKEPSTSTAVAGKFVPITKTDTPKFTIAKDIQGRPVTKIISIPASQLKNQNFPKKFITIPISNLKPVTSVASAGDSNIKAINFSALKPENRILNGTLTNDINKNLPQTNDRKVIANKQPASYTIQDGNITKIENANKTTGHPTIKPQPSSSPAYIFKNGKLITTNITVNKQTNLPNPQAQKFSPIAVTIPPKKANATTASSNKIIRPTRMPLDEFMKLLKQNEKDIGSNVNLQQYPNSNATVPSTVKESTQKSTVPSILQVHSNYQGDKDLLRMTQLQVPKKSILHELFKDEEMAEKRRAENRKRKMEKLVFGEVSSVSVEKKVAPAPPVPSKRRRKEALIPMNVDFELLDEPEAQFVMPERPNVNTFLMYHLAKIQSVAKGLMAQLNISPIDFLTTTDFIRQYKYAKKGN